MSFFLHKPRKILIMHQSSFSLCNTFLSANRYRIIEDDLFRICFYSTCVTTNEKYKPLPWCWCQWESNESIRFRQSCIVVFNKQPRQLVRLKTHFVGIQLPGTMSFIEEFYIESARLNILVCVSFCFFLCSTLLCSDTLVVFKRIIIEKVQEFPLKKVGKTREKKM